jgi:hypothetical protein
VRLIGGFNTITAGTRARKAAAPPAVEDIPNQTVNEGDLITVPIVVDTLGEGDVDYKLRNAPANAQLDSSNSEITYTATTVGTYTFDFLVEDNVPGVRKRNERRTAQKFNLTVLKVPPTVPNIGDQTVNEGGEVSFNVNASHPTVTPTYSVLSGPGIIDSNGNYSYTTSTGPATYEVTIRVSRDEEYYVDRSFSIIVEVSLPTVSPVSNIIITEGSQGTRQVTASHPDGVEYQVQSGPGSINSSGLYSYTPADNGTEEIVIRVTRSGSPANFVDVSFDVIATNVSPSISLSGADTATAGSSYSLTLGTVTDPGSDTVTNYRVNWGDGTFTNYTIGGAKTHTYTTTGARTITVDLTDEDGTYTNAGAKNITVSQPSGSRSWTGGSSTSTTATWRVPSYVTVITVEAVGAGGGGGGAGGTTNGGGGGGGAYVRTSLNVTPGETLSIQVGKGGNGGTSTSSGSFGGDTFVKRSTTVLMRAGAGDGGRRGQSGGAPGAGGTGTTTGFSNTISSGNNGSGSNGGTPRNQALGTSYGGGGNGQTGIGGGIKGERAKLIITH